MSLTEKISSADVPQAAGVNAGPTDPAGCVVRLVDVLQFLDAEIAEFARQGVQPPLFELARQLRY